jgi:phage tail protein X
MGEDPDVIRQQIEQTRARMGDTVDALSYKADVKARVKDAVTERKDAAVGAVTGALGSARDAIAGTTDTVTSRVGERTPDAQDVRRTAKRAAGLAQENPLGLAIGAAAVGFLVGLMVPSTRVEDERMGELSDQVKSRVQEAGQEALDRGRQVAQDAAESAMSTAKESGQQHAQELAATAGDSAREVVEAARPDTGS